MGNQPDIAYKRLMGHLGHWSWVHLMYRFDASHLIVADFSFIQHLRSVRSDKLSAQVATPDDADLFKREGIKKILVFLEKQELPVLRRLQTHYSDAIVCSGTYGYGCVGPNRTPKFSGLTAKGIVPKAPKTLFLSTSYAGAEFVAAAMGAAGLPSPHEYFARPLLRWLSRHTGFQPVRFFCEVQSRYSSKTAEAPMQLLQMDVLSAILQPSNLSLARMIKFLKDGGTQVVVVKRRDRLAQVAEAQLLDHTAERSVWTKKPSKKLENKIEQVPFKDCIARLDALRAEDGLLQAIETQLPEGSVLSLTLEDFIEDQLSGIGAICGHTGLPAPEQFDPINYAGGYETAPDIGWLTDTVVRQFIDRMGLHHLPVPEGDRQPVKAV